MYKTSTPRPLPPLECLHERLRIDADGALRNRISRGAARAGSIAGTTRKDGYCRINIDGRLYYAHRIVWKMHYGEEPPKYIDHVDGDPSNNRPDNLREATQSQNQVNAKKNMRSNTSGLRGVYWDDQRDKWHAGIMVDYCRFHLGRFDDPIVAAMVFDRAALAIAEWRGYATTNEALGAIPLDRRLTDAQAAAVDCRLLKHGLLKEDLT